MDNLKDRITAYLSSSGETLCAFCDRNGLDRSNVWRFLNGKQKGFHMATYQKILDALPKRSKRAA